MSIVGHVNIPDLIPSSEAAVIVGLTQRTFNRRVDAGVIVPAMVLPGEKGTRLFRRSDIEKLAARLAKAS